MTSMLLIAGVLIAASPAAAQTAPPAGGAPGGPPVLRIAPASRGAVYITKADVDRAANARGATPPGGPGAPPPPGAPGGMAGPALATLGVVRGGDDRINVDIIKRLDARAEGPVIHQKVTEIYYIIEGGGNFETGGSIPNATPMVMPGGAPVNPANIGPSLRGETIVGGTTRHVGVGDAVMIPPDVPHRFVTLDGGVTYLVVRINPGFEKGR